MKLMKSTITIILILVPLLYLRPVFSALNTTGNPNSIIRLATTTSTDNSGLLAYLLPVFENKTGYRVHVIAVGTGKALRMGRDGDADVLLVHAPAAETDFINAGYGEKREPVMYNDFVLVGAASNPASIKMFSGINQALKQIADHKSIFISRGDNSGTHKKEMSLWQAENIHPQGKWYREVGQGMGKVLQMAAELDAYTLTDRGTWLAYLDNSPLKILNQGDPKLYNPYHIIAVNPERFASINHQGARALINWITSNDGQSLIARFTLNDTLLFKPSANSRQLATQSARP
jgi:tungstate transport system substrate-binding protein